MKKQLMTGLFTVLALTAGAQTFQEWRNPEINAVNRAPMHTNYFAFENADAAKKANKKQSTNYMTLNGTWKFNWVKDADSRPTDFWKTGFNDKGWDDLQVPAVWELNGYGDPIYVNVGYAWRNQFQNNPPEVPTENNHVGSYRREIVVPASWNGKDIIAHFGSVTSNMYLWVNGRYVGYSEDSKLEAEFDLTPYLKPGQKNLIAFQVFRWCDGSYLEDQDFFRYSGVGRDCYLYARNKKRIQDIRVTPDLDAAYQNGSLAINLDLKGSGKVDLELVDAQGKQVATATANKSGLITMNVENPKKWSAETPYLYTLRASMQGSNEVIPVKVGFRKIELKGDQILVNGKAVLFKGADRHEMDPATRLWPRTPLIRKPIWNVTSAMYNADSTTQASSSGHWVMKPATAPTSNNAINGLKQKTPAVPANMNKHARKTIPISSVRCIMATKEWKNTVNVPMLPNH